MYEYVIEEKIVLERQTKDCVSYFNCIKCDKRHKTTKKINFLL